MKVETIATIISAKSGSIQSAALVGKKTSLEKRVDGSDNGVDENA